MKFTKRSNKKLLNEIKEQLANKDRKSEQLKEDLKRKIWWFTQGWNIETVMPTMMKNRWERKGWINEEDRHRVQRDFDLSNFKLEWMLEDFISAAKRLEGEEYQNAKNEISKLRKELEFEKDSADCHLDAINTCKNWYFSLHVNPLNEKLVNKSKEAEDNWKLLQEAEAQIKKLEKDLEDREDVSEQFKKLSKKFEKQEVQIRKLGREAWLNKPLPKTPSKFKLFKQKVKTKLQQLVEKAKVQEQKTVARVEVPIK